jgi:hypothetical protein
VPIRIPRNVVEGRFVDVTGGAVAELVNRAPPDVFAEVARR